MWLALCVCMTSHVPVTTSSWAGERSCHGGTTVTCLRKLQSAADASAAELRGACGECAQAAARLRDLDLRHAAAMQQVRIS
jgi:hypothetical protein